MSRIVPFLLLVLLVTVAPGQTRYQTLPRGYDNLAGGAATSWPVNVLNNQVWQWHYDSSEFDVQAPITISDLAIRPASNSPINAFYFDRWIVTLMEARTDYLHGDPALHRNVLRSQRCRSGPWSGGPFLPAPGGTIGGFLSMGLTESFTYDPSTGNDLIIQIEKCSTTIPWGTNMDAVLGSPASLGGVRRGNTTSCTLEMQNNGPSAGFAMAPIVRVAYHPSSQTLPRGFDAVDGNAVINDPVTSSGPQKWHWHYDAAEFEVQAPIAIREIWVRSALPGVGTAAFAFASFEVTLASATTDYLPGNRLPEFARNVDDQKVVRTGAWISGPVAPGGATGTWIPLGLTESFVYDPSTGQDLIVQIESCGGGSPLGEPIDGRLGLNIGGNRYGHLGDCEALSPNAPPPLQVVPIIRIDYEPSSSGHGAIDRFPWREDFDAFSAHGWENLERECRLGQTDDWALRTGPTPSASTGPSGDHTSGSGRYVYVEDSDVDNVAIGYISPVLDLAGLANPTLSFWMHSHAASANSSTLHVDIVRPSGGPVAEDIVVAYGPQGPAWVEKTIDLGNFLGETIRLRFRVDNFNSWGHNDIAIDDIRVYDPAVLDGQAAQVAAALDLTRALTVTGLPVTLGLAGPYFSTASFGEAIELRISGGPFQPVAMWTAPLNPAVAAFPGIGQLDVGLPDASDFTWLFDGIADPAGPATDGAGVFSLGFTNTLPPGMVIPLQAAVLTGGPGVVALSNCAVLQT